MDAIYSYALQVLGGLELAEFIGESMYPTLLTSPRIVSNCTYYHDMRALLGINKVPNLFPDLAHQTPVVFRIIKALCPEWYGEPTNQWTINKRHHDKETSRHNVNTINQPQAQDNMQRSYGYYQGTSQEFREAPAPHHQTLKRTTIPNKPYKTKGDPYIGTLQAWVIASIH